MRPEHDGFYGEVGTVRPNRPRAGDPADSPGEGVAGMGLLRRSALLISLLLASGCAPTPGELPARDEVYKTLAEIIFNPYQTCEDLRTAFGLEYLEPVDNPGEAGLGFEEHWIAAEDDNLLHVWYLPSRLKRGTVLLCNGAAGDVSCYLFVARLLVNQGWSVVMYDYRGFGLSTGTPDLAWLVPDAATVAEWATARVGQPAITVMGISLGTIPAVGLGVSRPELVNGVVLDSPVALGAEIQRFGMLLGDLGPYVLALLDPLLVSESVIHDLTRPLLVFLSERDFVTPATTVSLVYDRAPEPKELVVLEGLQHAEGPYHETARYMFHLDTFLAEVWGTK